MKAGHQTYSWEMLGASWRGSPDDIMDMVAASGYLGVEFSNVMIGGYADRPAEFRRALEKRGLAAAAFAYARSGFTDPGAWKDDLEGAQKALDFAGSLSVPVGIAGPSSDSQADAEKKLDQACRFYNEVARRGREQGVVVAVHPHSHHTSLVLTADRYDTLLAATEESGLMFNPDTGHIIRGGQDPVACFRRHLKRIVHVHCKDVDAKGGWQPLGKGVCDFPSLVRLLRDGGYQGWLISEEESDLVRSDLPGAMTANRAYLRSLGI
jgi:sugar phosphate isomerase/epimerase